MNRMPFLRFSDLHPLLADVKLSSCRANKFVRCRQPSHTWRRWNDEEEDCVKNERRRLTGFGVGGGIAPADVFLHLIQQVHIAQLRFAIHVHHL